MLKTQIKLDKKIIEMKDCYTEIYQLKLKLSAALTEKHLWTSSLNSLSDFYHSPSQTLRLSEKISDFRKLSNEKSFTFET